MIVTSRSGKQIEIPDESADVIVMHGDDIAATWWMEANDTMRLSKHTEWINDRWQPVAYKVDNESTGETWIIDFQELHKR